MSCLINNKKIFFVDRKNLFSDFYSIFALEVFKAIDVKMAVIMLKVADDLLNVAEVHTRDTADSFIRMLHTYATSHAFGLQHPV